MSQDTYCGQPFTGHASYISSVAFSPEGKTLASGSYDNTIILWDIETGQPIGQPLSGHSVLISSVAFSPDGSILASSSYDGTIILWDVDTRQPIGQPLVGQTYSPINTLAFSPNGRFLASGSETFLLLWDVDPESWIDLACQRAGRNFTRSEWERFFPGKDYEQTCPQWPSDLEVDATAIPTESPVIDLATATMTPTILPATATITSGAGQPTPTRTPTPIPATATPIRTSSSTFTATAPVLYRVINVTKGVDLNIRAGPGTKYDVVGEIPYNGTGILLTGNWIRAENTIWYPITFTDSSGKKISGWVNSYYLAPE